MLSRFFGLGDGSRFCGVSGLWSIDPERGCVQGFTSMIRRGFRFYPSEVVFGSEVCWSLLRSVGPPQQDFSNSVKSEGVHVLAEAHNLRSRIGAWFLV
jgi:hypothetical protein